MSEIEQRRSLIPEDLAVQVDAATEAYEHAVELRRALVAVQHLEGVTVDREVAYGGLARIINEQDRLIHAGTIVDPRELMTDGQIKRMERLTNRVADKLVLDPEEFVVVRQPLYHYHREESRFTTVYAGLGGVPVETPFKLMGGLQTVGIQGGTLPRFRRSRRADYSVEFEDGSIDTRRPMDGDLYKAFIAELKARDEGPLPDSPQAGGGGREGHTSTVLTGVQKQRLGDYAATIHVGTGYVEADGAVTLSHARQLEHDPSLVWRPAARLSYY